MRRVGRRWEGKKVSENHGKRKMKMKKQWMFLVWAAICAVGTTPGWAINLLQNPGFEGTPGSTLGEGILPNDWEVSSVTPDTYSTAFDYGLDPEIFGNFSGVAAFGGTKWVAGWSAANERFGQTLGAALTPGYQYYLDGFLHQGVRTDVNFQGGYDVYLNPDADGSTLANAVLLGHLGDTEPVANGWTYRGFSFFAPAEAMTHTFLLFDPVATNLGESVYPGLDNVSLTFVAVPEPAWAGWLLGLAGVGAVWVSRRKNGGAVR